MHRTIKNKIGLDVQTFANDFLFMTTPCLGGGGEPSVTNVCLPGQRCASGKCSLPEVCKTQNEGTGSWRGPPCPLEMNCRKGHHGLLLRKPAAKSKIGRGKKMGGNGSFDSGNYDLLTSFFSFLIIYLTVDMTLIIDGQVGPGQEQGFS